MADEKMKSENVNELATALAKAQGALTDAKKDSVNPFFKSKYADLSSVWGVCRKPLSDNGLSVLQFIEKENDRQVLTTVLLHSSGQFFSSKLDLIIKGELTMQSIGSAITYARRYCLASMVGVCSEEDDDAESTVIRPPKASPSAPLRTSPEKSKPIEDTLKDKVPQQAASAQIEGIPEFKTADEMLIFACDKVKMKAIGRTAYTYEGAKKKLGIEKPADVTNIPAAVAVLFGK